MSALLRRWKRDGSALAQQYDTDGDGDIDSGEWQRAVTDAESEVVAQDDDMRRKPGLHMMRAPVDGRPFLLSSRHPDELRQRYNLWAWFYLILFVAVSAWGLAELFPGSP